MEWWLQYWNNFQRIKRPKKQYSENLNAEIDVIQNYEIVYYWFENDTKEN
jgi:hypothetical protein